VPLGRLRRFDIVAWSAGLQIGGKEMGLIGCLRLCTSANLLVNFAQRVSDSSDVTVCQSSESCKGLRTSRANRPSVRGGRFWVIID
jgi:hypothetical protein